MSTLRNKLIVLAAVGILAVVGSLMNSRKANAQGGSLSSHRTRGYCGSGRRRNAGAGKARTTGEKSAEFGGIKGARETRDIEKATL
jgi:hypothetical protein